MNVKVFFEKCLKNILIPWSLAQPASFLNLEIVKAHDLVQKTFKILETLYVSINYLQTFQNSLQFINNLLTKQVGAASHSLTLTPIWRLEVFQITPIWDVNEKPFEYNRKTFNLVLQKLLTSFSFLFVRFRQLKLEPNFRDYHMEKCHE